MMIRFLHGCRLEAQRLCLPAARVMLGYHASWMPYRYRSGDANMRSVWLCSRNDAIGNVAVMFAALGVFGTGSAWPDLAVAAILGTLSVSAAFSIIRHSLRELENPNLHPQHDPAHHQH